MRWSEQDQDKSSISHIGFVLMHEKIKDTHLIFFLLYTYSEGKNINKQQMEDKTKVKITPITILIAQ